MATLDRGVRAWTETFAGVSVHRANSVAADTGDALFAADAGCPGRSTRARVVPVAMRRRIALSRKLIVPFLPMLSNMSWEEFNDHHITADPASWPDCRSAVMYGRREGSGIVYVCLSPFATPLSLPSCGAVTDCSYATDTATASGSPTCGTYLAGTSRQVRT